MSLALRGIGRAAEAARTTAVAASFREGIFMCTININP
jgi:hypothetical protein